MRFLAAITLGSSAHSLFSITCILIAILSGLQTVSAELDAAFKSRPDLFSPIVTFERRIPQKLHPGYIFIGPYEATNSGPYIYDNDGNLVWSGWGNSGPGNAHGMHVCQYQGKDHLCFFQGIQQNGYCRGHGVIMDSHYHIVKTVVPGGGMASSDMHEFKLVDGGKRALLTVYQQRQFDMSIWNIKKGMGWLMESVFQEVDVETGRVLFEWRSLDHIDPSLSYTHPGSTDTSGTGLEPRSPWDYFHINSIDKDEGGNYLISSRHTCAIYKISGRDGSIIWQLHGATPSFNNTNFSFSQQHDARWMSQNRTHTLLSLYNNGYNGYNRTHWYSSGMTVLIDHMNKTATQLQDYGPDKFSMISSSQGNMQVLSNGNVFMGWGNNAYISEHDEEGNLLLWANIGKGSIMNYRAQKFRWVGNPTDIPALWTYSKGSYNSSATTFYASWNGATRIKYWRFYGTNNSTGNYTLLRRVRKDGFETSYTASEFYRYSYAEAVDSQGNALGRSRKQFTFTPSPGLQGNCEETTCENTYYYGDGEKDAAATVPEVGLNTVPWVDPDHPGAHLDWGNTRPTAPEDKETGALEEAYGWFAPTMGVLFTGIGIYVLLRVYRKHQFSSHRVRRSSSEALDLDQDVANEPKASFRVSSLPWWSWRRWTAGEPARYFPLSDSEGHGRAWDR